VLGPPSRHRLIATAASHMWLMIPVLDHACHPQVDALGYYAALGLDGKRSRNVSAEDIKSAFRYSSLDCLLP
jgi:hypothetical protein